MCGKVSNNLTNALWKLYEDLSGETVFGRQANPVIDLEKKSLRNLARKNAPEAIFVACDVGGHFGYNLAETSRELHPNANLINLDIARSNLLKADKRIDNHIQGDCNNLPFKNSCVDFILCSEVLEHVPTPSKTLAEFHRVLTEGGLLAMSTPANNYIRAVYYQYVHHFRKDYVLLSRISEDQAAIALADHEGKRVNPHFHEGFSANGLAKLLREQGFRVCTVQGIIPRFSFIGRHVIQMLQKLILLDPTRRLLWGDIIIIAKKRILEPETEKNDS